MLSLFMVSCDVLMSKLDWKCLSLSQRCRKLLGLLKNLKCFDSSANCIELFLPTAAIISHENSYLYLSLLECIFLEGPAQAHLSPDGLLD